MIKLDKSSTIFIICLILSASTILVVSYQCWNNQRLNSASVRDNFNFVYLQSLHGGKVLPYIEVNSLDNTYTNTLTSSGGTINTKLSRNEMDDIYIKMIEVGFFDYPYAFSNPHLPAGAKGPPGSNGFTSIYVEYNNTIKEVIWFYNTTYGQPPIVEDDFFTIQNLIIETVKSNSDYKKIFSSD